MVTHSFTATLTPTAPFDFDQSLRFAARFNPRQAMPSQAPRSITQAVRVEGQTVVFRVESLGTMADPRLSCTLHAGVPVSLTLRTAAVDRLGFYLSAADDLRPFYALAEHDPPFLPVLDALYGYHQVKFLTPFENAVWAILSQRNQWSNAQRMASALVTRYGTALTVDGQDYWAYPDPGAMASADPGEIASIIRHQPKGAQVAGVARAFASADEHFLRAAPYAEVEAWLLAIPGIGPWSASFILLRGFGRTQRLPAGDRFIQAGFARFYGPANFNERAAYYGDWRGYWGHYLRAVE